MAVASVIQNDLALSSTSPSPNLQSLEFFVYRPKRNTNILF